MNYLENRDFKMSYLKNRDLKMSYLENKNRQTCHPRSRKLTYNSLF